MKTIFHLVTTVLITVMLGMAGLLRADAAQNFTSQLTPNVSGQNYSAAPVAPDFLAGGSFGFNVSYCNNSTSNLSGLLSLVSVLANNNSQQNRDRNAPSGIAGGPGAELDFDPANGYLDMLLSGSECVTVPYQIGLTARSPFQFRVNIKGEYGFVEDFPWIGEHAFFTNGGAGAAVWWNADNWEVRNGTQYEEVEANTPTLPYTGKFAAIQKAASTDNDEGAVVNNVLAANGNGSAGVGVMHMDFQGITSARLRNPMLIPAGGSATVSFFAPRFVTDGTWWEIAITPTTQTTAADFTAVPGRSTPESLNDPINGSSCPSNSGGCTNGPGNRVQVADSINVISTGWPDGPTCDGSDWYTRYAVTKAINGVVTDFVNPAGVQENLPVADPQENVDRELYPWQIVFTSTDITLKSDLDENGVLETIQHWNVTVPWTEVYLNLLYVAYQSDHHPQIGCGFGTFGIAQAQEMGWRHIVVSPVKYKRTYALPSTAIEARSLGFMSYDLRDVGAHFGAPVSGHPQPNTVAYDTYDNYLFCWQGDPNGGIFCGDPARQHNSVTLNLPISAQQMQGLSEAKLHADVRYTGSVAIQVNGQAVTPLAGVAANLPNDPGGLFGFEPEVWVERSTSFSPALLHAGNNTIQVTLQPQSGYYSPPNPGQAYNAQPVIEIDRIGLELYNTQ